eukprot:2313996-Alexandrium_andersonii.AAC.1
MQRVLNVVQSLLACSAPPLRLHTGPMPRFDGVTIWDSRLGAMLDVTASACHFRAPVQRA